MGPRGQRGAPEGIEGLLINSSHFSNCETLYCLFLKVFLNLKKDYKIIVKQNKIKNHTHSEMYKGETKIGFFFPGSNESVIWCLFSQWPSSSCSRSTDTHTRAHSQRHMSATVDTYSCTDTCTWKWQTQREMQRTHICTHGVAQVHRIRDTCARASEHLGTRAHGYVVFKLWHQALHASLQSVFPPLCISEYRKPPSKYLHTHHPDMTNSHSSNICFRSLFKNQMKRYSPV